MTTPQPNTRKTVTGQQLLYAHRHNDLHDKLRKAVARRQKAGRK